MALPTKGVWLDADDQPYTTARVWGTGINPIHEIYGEGPPLRVTGRSGLQEVTPAAESVPESFEPQYKWGYEQPGDYVGGDNTVYLDGRPDWGEYPTEYRGNTEGHPPWNAPRWVNAIFNGMFGGAHRVGQKLVDGVPSETVSEGWLNKPKGDPANAIVSDPSQYEVQTSMQQRYTKLVNDHAVERSTDEPRTPINSRVRGQKLKVYSEGERHYDMFPYQQDIIQRAWWYRTFGSGNANEMEPNEMTLRSPVRRVPPNDPSMGPQETDLESNDFGYTPEDTFYA